MPAFLFPNDARKMAAYLILPIFVAFPTVDAFYEPRALFSTGTRTLPRNLGTFIPSQQAAQPFTLTMGRPRTSTSLGGSFIEDFLTSSAPPTDNLAVPFLKQIQDMLSFLLQPIAALEYESFMGVAANMASIPFWTELTLSLQRVGEVLFIALLVVALLQGGLAVFQYRTNPSGELMIPPGLTVGVESPVDTTAKSRKKERPSYASADAAAALRSGGQTNSTDVSSFLGRAANQQKKNFSTESPTRYTRIITRMNSYLWVLAPWLAGRVGYIVQRNSHLFHIGSILTLTSIFDFPQSFFHNLRRSKLQDDRSNSTAAVSLSQGESEHVVVIGDSLAVGLGSVDQFDMNKTNDWPFQRIEHRGDPERQDDDEPGPAFPKALAQTLAKKLQKRVTWRSAGVDGGDVPKIRKFCLGVVDEEVQEGRIPDVVVILCGANDMKYFLVNPFQRSNWPKAFRSKLANLIDDIRYKAPETTIVVPAIPTQMFHKNSPVNVFPLGLLLDCVVGFWDSQKKFAVDDFASDGVQYIGLTPMEINRWYHLTNALDEPADATTLGDQSQADPGAITLIAKDGVHPNARCYTSWGAAIGRKLLANENL